MKVIYIENCHDCPHYEGAGGSVEAGLCCHYVQARSLSVDQSVPLPDWCPLRDVEQSGALAKAPEDALLLKLQRGNPRLKVARRVEEALCRIPTSDLDTFQQAVLAVEQKYARLRLTLEETA